MKSKIIQQFSIFSLPEIIAISLSVVTSPILTRLLTIEQYGAVPMLNAVWAIFGVVQFGGMDWALPYFLSRSNSLDTKRQIYTTSTIFVSLLSFLLLSLFSIWLFKSNFGYTNAHMTYLEQFVYLLSIFPSVIIGWLLYIYRFELQAQYYAKILIFSRILPILIAIPLMAIILQDYRLLLNLATNSTVLWIVLLWIFFDLKKNFTIKIKYFSPSLLRDMLSYGLILLIGGGFYYFFTIVDRVLISIYLTPQDMAIFTLAHSLGSSVLLVKTWFGRIFDPYVIKWINEDKINYLKEISQILFNLLAFTMCSLSLISLLLSEYIINLFYPSAYLQTAKIFPLIVLSGSISTLSLIPVVSTIISQKKIYHIFVYLIGLIVNLIISFYLISKFGVKGVVFGSIIGEFVILTLWLFVDWFILKNLKIKIINMIFNFLIVFLFFYLYYINFLKPMNLYETFLLLFISITFLIVINISTLIKLKHNLKKCLM